MYFNSLKSFQNSFISADSSFVIWHCFKNYKTISVVQSNLIHHLDLFNKSWKNLLSTSTSFGWNQLIKQNVNNFSTSSNQGSKSGRSNGTYGSSTGGFNFQCLNCGSPLKSIVPNQKYLLCESCKTIYTISENQMSDEIKNQFKSSSENKIRRPPPPKTIHQYLNKDVIGQEQVKKMLSVQIYSHYIRNYHHSKTCKKSAQTYEVTPLEFTRIDNRKNKSSKKSENAPSIAYPSLINSALPQNLLLPSKSFYESNNSKGSKTEKNQRKKLLSDSDDLKLDKSNIILLGSTGSGKTLLAKTLAKCLDVPLAICDCTTLTAAGYYGEDVESVVGQLLSESNYNVEKAQQGIIFLDEIDKICKKMGSNNRLDIGGEGVQQGLLKIIEGSIVAVSDGKLSMANKIEVDTTNILFIASGAFNGIDTIIRKRQQKRSVGFFDQSKHFDLEVDLDNVLMSIETKDLVDFGFLPEFIGRFPIIATLQSPNEDMLTKILIEPRNSVVSQYRFILGLDRCDLEITDDAIREIAKLAISKQCGARGLKSILEDLLMDARYEIPGSDICSVVITKDSVNRKEPVKLIRKSPISDITSKTNYINNV